MVIVVVETIVVSYSSSTSSGSSSHSNSSSSSSSSSSMLVQLLEKRKCGNINTTTITNIFSVIATDYFRIYSANFLGSYIYI